MKKTIKAVCAFIIVQSVRVAADEQWDPGRSRVETAPVVINAERGNWYKKQEYYKKARALYERIRERVGVAEEAVKSFDSKSHDIHDQLSRFNLEIGFTQGEVDGLLTDLVKDLEIERERTVELSEAERKSLEEIKQKKASLENLKKSLDLISGLADAVDKSLKNAHDKAAEAKQFEEKALKNYTQIADEISDKKAELLYLELKTFLDNIDEGIKYLTQQLGVFLDSKIQELQNKMQSVREESQQLKARGVELSKKVEAEEKADIMRAKQEKDKAQSAAPKPVEEKIGLWQSFKNKVSAVFGRIKNRLFGPKEPEKQLAIKQ